MDFATLQHPQLSAALGGIRDGGLGSQFAYAAGWLVMYSNAIAGVVEVRPGGFWGWGWRMADYFWQNLRQSHGKIDRSKLSVRSLGSVANLTVLFDSPRLLVDWKGIRLAPLRGFPPTRRTIK